MYVASSTNVWFGVATRLGLNSRTRRVGHMTRTRGTSSGPADLWGDRCSPTTWNGLQLEGRCEIKRQEGRWLDDDQLGTGTVRTVERPRQADSRDAGSHEAKVNQEEMCRFRRADTSPLSAEPLVRHYCWSSWASRSSVFSTSHGTAVRHVRGVSADGAVVSVSEQEFPLMATMATGAHLEPGNRASRNVRFISDDLRYAQEIALEEFRARSWLERVAERSANWLTWLL